MEEFIYIELTGTRREDNSVFIVSPDLPMFSVVGDSEEEALKLAYQLLPEYLRVNVPEYVEIKHIPSAKSAMSEISATGHLPLLPAHVIAIKNRNQNAGTKGGGPKTGSS